MPQPTPRSHGAGAFLPATVWLAPFTARAASAPTASARAVVPSWALARVRAEFTHRPGRTPLPLLNLALPGTEPGGNAQPSHPGANPGPWPRPHPGPAVVLAQLPPDGARGVCRGGPVTGGLDEGVPGFFHRVHRLLRRDGGLLLAACRQQHEAAGELLDPAGRLTACARSAGFVYRQHILIVHATADGSRLHPTPDAPAPQPAGVWRHRLLHTDLLLFTLA